MLSLTKFGIFAIIVCLLFPASSVYGHGFGIDKISSVDVQGKELSILVEMPMYFENDQEQITITVIDHIDEGKGLQVLNALRIDGRDGSLITIALNVPSGKFKKKDIIKVENKFLKDDDTNKLAVIAPKATINMIKNYKLVEKRRVSLPNEIDRIFRCSNPDCITNSTEHIESVMDVIDKEGRVLKCRYCARVLDVNQLKYN